MSVRFAPSPTGLFHVGNFRTAWVSHEWARRLGLPWVVRFENIDEPRNVPGARERQLEEMERLGLAPDRVLLQSDRCERHREVFARFLDEGLVYPCFCSRKTIREAVDRAASAPHQPVPAYTGTCRGLKTFPKTDLPTLAWRLRGEDESGRDDFVIGRTGTDRKNFVPAYHWACAIDDYDEGHDLLVRAWDLEEAARQQRSLQRLLGAKPFPAVFHASLVTADDGSRLEKRTQGVTLPELLGAGRTAEGLVEKFRESFTGDWSGFAPSRIFGETRRTLAVSGLLGLS